MRNHENQKEKMKAGRRPFMVITACYACGIMVAHWCPGRLTTVAILTALFFLANAWFCRRDRTASVLLMLALIGLGAVCTASGRLTSAKDIGRVARFYRRKMIAVRGEIKSPVEVRTSGFGQKFTFYLQVRAVKAPWGWDESGGKVLVNIFREIPANYRDLVELEGRLHRPYNFSETENFSYSDYLSHRGVRYILSVKKSAEVKVLARGHGHSIKSRALKWRDRLRIVLEEYLSENEAGVMKAVLLGDRSAISKPIRQLFVETGTAHVLAISGLHIGVVAAVFLVIVKCIPIGRKAQFIVVIAGLTAYAFVTGGRPSVVRATIMINILLAGLVIEKEPDALNTLYLAALVLLIYNPLNLFDIGFQLSFTCVLAIIAVNRMLRAHSFAPAAVGPYAVEQPGSKIRQMAVRSLLISSAVWAAVAGWVAYYFGIVTPVSILVNVLVVPLLSAIVALGFGVLATGIMIPPLAPYFAVCLKVILNGLVGIIFLCDKLPFSHFYIRGVKNWHVAAYYLLLLISIKTARSSWAQIIAGNLRGYFQGGKIDKHTSL